MRPGTDADAGAGRERGSPLDAIRSDSLVLVSGPPLAGKYRLMFDVVARHADGVVVVSTKHRADRVRDDYRSVAGDVPDGLIGVVDCGGYHEGATTAEEADRTKYAPPENLTRIGVKFTEVFDAFREDPDVDHAGVCLHSATQLLMHSDAKRVYKFLQVLAGQVRDAGVLGVVVVDSPSVDERDLRTLYHHFDDVVEIREPDAGELELRVRSTGSPASAWTAL